jgi:hypothetical protein
MVEWSKKPAIRIELTPEQKEQIRKATGKEVTAVKLQADVLEERIAPGLDPN